MNIKVKKKYFNSFFFKIFFCAYIIFLPLKICAQINVSTATGTGYNGNTWLQSVPPGITLSAAGIAFIIENTNLTPVTLTNLSCHLGTVDGSPAGTPVSTKLYYSSSLSGPYNLSSGWIQIGTGSAVVPSSPTITPVISGINFLIPAQTQYRFVLEASTGLHFSSGPPAPTPNLFTSGGVNLKVGDYLISGQYVGFVGVSPNGNTSPGFFGGTVTLVPSCTGAPNPGNTLSSTQFPSNPCFPFNLSLQNNPNVSGLSYQWQYRAPAIGINTFTNITGATSSTLTTTLNNTNPVIQFSQGIQVYYRANVTCSGNTTPSNEIAITNLTTQYVFTGSGAWTNPGNWLCNMIPPEPITAPLVSINGNAIKNGLNIGASGTVTIALNNTLTLTGNLVNAGTLNGQGQLIMDAGTSTVSNTGTISTGFLLNSDTMTLLSNLSPSSMNLTNDSKVILGNFDLNMASNALMGGNASNFVVTNGFGRLIRTVGNTDVLFPIGFTASSYNPATLNNVSGPPEIFKVRVGTGVTTTGRTMDPITNGNVDRTWHIDETTQGGTNATVRLEWRQSDEQSGFDRSQSYISHFQGCPPPDPPLCSVGFYDFQTPSAAVGSNPYSQVRTNVTSFHTTSFIVTSRGATYTFLNMNANGPGDGNWNNPNNWANMLVAPTTISPGTEVIIDPIVGECTITGPLNILPGGKLTVKPGKKLNMQ